MENKIIKINTTTIIVLYMLGFCLTNAYTWQSDNGDGTFTNPVLYADYPDPDIIRVGEDFYMTSSTFVSSPGITILHSRDIVNWEIISHAAATIDGGGAYNMVNDTAYEGGFWAPSIRYYDGTFYVAVQPTFADGRIYYATNPAGPWNFHQLDRNIYDPGLFFDDDGTGYIICGHGPQSVMTLNSNYSAVVAQIDNAIDSGGEGSHVIKRGSFYYLFNANPGVWPFQLRCSRATNIFGPWETGHICLTATTGGHQGAIVDIDDHDNWFGFVHQDSGSVGRMPRIGPVFWENNWPVFGTLSHRDVMADTYTKPVQGQPIMQPATSDDFSSATLGLQWQWNHNPDNTRWSLTQHPGFLRLRSTQADGFWTARNTLTQKGQGPQSHGIVKLDISNLQAGDIAGFGTLGKVSAHIAVVIDSHGDKTLTMNMRKDKVGSYTGASDVPVYDDTIYLRTDLDFEADLGICSYSEDGTNWTTLGGNFELMFGYGSTWQGEQFAIFCYNPDTANSVGYVDVDSFTLGETADLITTQRGRPTLNAEGMTFVGDNGQLLRGPFGSTEWTSAPPYSEVERIKELGFNSVHLYAECFNLDYPDPGATAPGYAVTEVDKYVNMTRGLGLYLIMTIGNGANNGNYNYDYIVDFWDFYAERYADETHVLFEIQNEPVAWGPPYSDSGANPSGAIDMEVAAYNTIRSHAPDTPVLLFSYAVFGGSGGANSALTDINAFNSRVGGNPSAIWSKTAVGFHGYAGWQGTSEAVETLLAAGYPCFMTEFGSGSWGINGGGFDVHLASELERLKVSWNTFQYIPPWGVSDNVTVPECYKDRVDRAGMSWTPDYGTWPVARGAYSDDGLPWATTSTWSNNFLTGTLRIEAEDFDTGGQGVAYNDGWINEGGKYRTNETVDITVCSDIVRGYKVGWTDDGEWMEYTIWVKEPGFYDLDLRYATPNNDCLVQVFCNEKDKTGQWSLPHTGSWGTWRTATQEVFLEYGLQKLRIEIPIGGFDLNWIELSPSTTAPIANGTYKLVNQNSGKVMENNTSNNKVMQNAYSGANIQKWNLLHLGAGQYRVRSMHDNWYWNTWYNTMTWWWGIENQGQRFIFRPIGDGYFRIMPVDSGMSFEVENASLANGAAIVSNEYAGLASQKWGILSPSALAFPTCLSASAPTSSQIDLTWNGVSGASSYNVKRSKVSGGPYTTIATGVTNTEYIDDDVVEGVSYYYVVCAVSGRQESLNSNEANSALMHVHLKFDEGRGATTASDSTGNGWNGTLVGGARWTSGKFDNAVYLDGSNDYVSLPAGVVDGLTDFTISTWVNLNTISTWSRVFDFGTGTTVNMFLTPRSWTGAVRFAITVGGAGGEEQIDGSSALPSGVWTHVAVTLKSGNGILYVDGVEVGRDDNITLNPTALGMTTQNYIGRSQYVDPYLNGCVDDFRIYSSALSASELAALATQ